MERLYNSVMDKEEKTYEEKLIRRVKAYAVTAERRAERVEQAAAEEGEDSLVRAERLDAQAEVLRALCRELSGEKGAVVRTLELTQTHGFDLDAHLAGEDWEEEPPAYETDYSKMN